MGRTRGPTASTERPPAPDSQAMDDKQAQQTEAVSVAIIEAIDRTVTEKEIPVILAALGVVVGVYARGSADQDASLRLVNALAKGVCSGELLE